jgi:hypothetical protein
MKFTVLLAVFVAGCAATNSYSRVAVLQHKETKQTVECRYPEVAAIRLSSHIETCIATYEKAGYKLLADSAYP